MADDYTSLPANLPAPVDDGAADHLPGTALPPLALASTTGAAIDLARRHDAGRLVTYVYPRTGTPGQPSPAGWDDIPGARGCTPQSCAYRNAQEQAEFAVREHIPFPLLSDRACAWPRRSTFRPSRSRG
jgi:peroxiredoxin